LSDENVAALKKARHLKCLRLGPVVPVSRSALLDLFEGLAPSLEELHIHLLGPPWPFHWDTNLSVLDIRIAPGSSAWMERIPEVMTKLRSLTLQQSGNSTDVDIDLTSLKHLEDVNFDLSYPRGSARIFMLPSSIRNLRLVTSARWLETTVVKHDLQNLESLTLRLANAAIALDQMLSTTGQDADKEDIQVQTPILRLETTSVSVFWLLETIASNKERFEALNDLIVHDAFGEVDGQLELAAAHLKSLSTLESVDLSGSAITGIGVRELLKLPNLKELTLNDCRALGRDAVDLARSQGIKVQARSTAQEAGGRKVRY
jgi:hypothetical protein